MNTSEVIYAGIYTIIVSKIEYFSYYEGTVKIHFDSGSDLILSGDDARGFMKGVKELST